MTIHLCLVPLIAYSVADVGEPGTGIYLIFLPIGFRYGGYDAARLIGLLVDKDILIEEWRHEEPSLTVLSLHHPQLTPLLGQGLYGLALNDIASVVLATVDVQLVCLLVDDHPCLAGRQVTWAQLIGRGDAHVLVRTERLCMPLNCPVANQRYHITV